MNRFEDAPDAVVELVDKVREQWFPELARARVKVLFDTKRRKSRGNWVLARIQRSNELIRHLTIEETHSEQGYDYILYLDKAVWEAIEEKDRIRIVRHELRHTFYDLEAKGTPYKLVGHDVEDFLMEIELNKDDPRWKERCAAIASSLYESDGQVPEDDPNQEDMFKESQEQDQSKDGVIDLEQRRAGASK